MTELTRMTSWKSTKKSNVYCQTSSRHQLLNTFQHFYNFKVVKNFFIVLQVVTQENEMKVQNGKQKILQQKNVEQFITFHQV